MKESGTSKSIEKFLTRRRCNFCYIVRALVDDPAILQRSSRTTPESRSSAPSHERSWVTMSRVRAKNTRHRFINLAGMQSTFSEFEQYIVVLLTVRLTFSRATRNGFLKLHETFWQLQCYELLKCKHDIQNLFIRDDLHVSVHRKPRENDRIPASRFAWEETRNAQEERTNRI